MSDLSKLKKKTEASMQAILWQGSASVALNHLTTQDYAIATTFNANATPEEITVHAACRDRSSALYVRASAAEEAGDRNKYHRLEAASNLIYLNMIDTLLTVYCRANPLGENLLVQAFAHTFNKNFSRGEPTYQETCAEVEKSGAKTLARIIKVARQSACN